MAKAEGDGLTSPGLSRAEARQALFDGLLRACRNQYGAGLLSVVVFGSMGRAVAGPDSDLDCLLVVEWLPDGRMPRVRDFNQIEKEVRSTVPEQIALSPVFKTPAEVEVGSLLFLDMVEDGRVLYDRDNFIEDHFARLRERLKQLGARRVWRGSAWYWDLKPDYRPGEVFTL